MLLPTGRFILPAVEKGFPCFQFYVRLIFDFCERNIFHFWKSKYLRLLKYLPLIRMASFPFLNPFNSGILAIFASPTSYDWFAIRIKIFLGRFLTLFTYHTYLGIVVESRTRCFYRFGVVSVFIETQTGCSVKRHLLKKCAI